MKIYIVRHGDTTHIREGLVQGWIGSELSDSGRKQAEILAEKLTGQPIDLIFTSDLGRARQTAEIIADKLGKPTVFDWLLRERYLGALQGTKRHDINWEKYNTDSPESRQKNIETLAHLVERAQTFLNNLELLPAPATSILVVSHNGLINALLRCLNPNHTDYEYRKIEHTEIVEVVYEPESLKP